MIYYNLKKLKNNLLNNSKNIFLIFGEEYFLIKKSLNQIIKLAKLKKFNESHFFNITNKTNWNTIYQNAQNISLFSKKKILILKLIENNNNNSLKKIKKLINLKKSNLLIILIGKKINTIKNNTYLYQKIRKNGIYINCSSLEKHQLFNWIKKKAKKMSIHLEEKSNKLLCCYYERNLFALNQILKNLIILYPDKIFSFKRIKKFINNTANFGPYNWIKSVFFGKTKYSLFILKKLKKNNFELSILLNIIQKELILILKIKKNKIKTIQNQLIYYKIWKIRQPEIKSILHRLSINNIQLSINLISKIELDLKKNYSKKIWNKLEMLTIFLCDEIPSKILKKIIIKNYYKQI